MQDKISTPRMPEIRNQTQTKELTEQTRKRKKPKNKKEIDKFWDFAANEKSNTAELLLYGQISDYSWCEDDITPKAFNDDLKSIGTVDEITVRINSGGGDVFAAMAIYTRLKDHAANIAVKIDGWCASAATIIAMAGDSIEIAAGGTFMIHDPAAGMLGYYKADELKKIANELETIKQSIVNCYMTVTDKPEDEIKSLMSVETYFTGEEAVNAGFCTALMFTDVKTEIENSEIIIVNSVPINLSAFNTVPKRLLGCADSHNKTDINKKIKDNEEEEILTLDEFKTKYPDIANAYKNEIVTTATTTEGTKEADHTAAVDAERARIKAIDEITLPGYEDLAAKAKYETPISAEAFAMQIVAAQKKVGQKFLNDREEDLSTSGVKDVTPISNAGGAGDDEDPFGTIIDNLYPNTK